MPYNVSRFGPGLGRHLCLVFVGEPIRSCFSDVVVGPGGQMTLDSLAITSLSLTGPAEITVDGQLSSYEDLVPGARNVRIQVGTSVLTVAELTDGSPDPEECP